MEVVRTRGRIYIKGRLEMTPGFGGSFCGGKLLRKEGSTRN